MDKNIFFGSLGFLLCCFCSVSAALKIKEIIAPDFVEDGTKDELILDCDYEAEGEEDVVVKWFFNGLEEQIYQWIASSKRAYASGHLKDLIDTDYRASNDTSSMFRALKFKEVGPVLSGNYTCKVSSEQSDDWRTKQIIIYSPATYFEMVLIPGDETFPGDEVVICDVAMVSPRPLFELYISGGNGTVEMPEEFHSNKTETSDENGFYNVSITLPFNSSYLDEGTTKFVCELTIPGTNYSELKSVEHVIEPEQTECELFFEENYPDSNATSSNSTGENKLTDADSGKIHLRSSLLTVAFLMFSLLFTT